MKKYFITLSLLGASCLTFAQAPATAVSSDKKEWKIKLPYDDAVTEEDQTVGTQIAPSDSSDYTSKSNKEMRKKKSLFVHRSGSSRSKASAK